MSQGFKKFLKISFPIGLGFLIIYLFYNQLDEQAIGAFKGHLKNANYYWVLVASLIALISHVSRTIRWRMMVNSLGNNISFWAALYSIFVNYIVNLGIPRTGELARCGVLSQYYKVAFDKSFGALINERVIDIVFLGLSGLFTFLFQYHIFSAFTDEYLKPFLGKSSFMENENTIWLIFGGIVLATILVFFLAKKRNNLLLNKIIGLFSGIKEGLVSIKKLKSPFWFVFHSIIIWLLYWLMIYVVFFAVEGGEAITPLAALSILFFGTFAFIAVSGGFGAYPVIMGIVVSLYGMDAILGNAVGWLLWGGQTILILVTGSWAFFMLSLVKSD